MHNSLSFKVAAAAPLGHGIRHGVLCRCAAAALILLLSALVGCTLAGDPQPAGPIETGPLPGEASNLAPAALPDANNGAAVYAQNCVRCHGPAGKGDGEFGAQLAQQGAQLPDFSDPATLVSQSPERLFRIVTNGNIQQLMPPFSEALTDQQRWDVAYYLYSFSTPPEVLAQGKTLYEGLCQSCHGPDGAQNGLTDIGKMAALDEQTLILQFVSSASDATHRFPDLRPGDDHAIAMYTRTFAYKALSAQVAEPPTPTAAPTEQVTEQPTEIAAPTEGATTEGTPGATEAATEGATEAATELPTPQATPTGPVAFGTVTGKVENGTAGGAVPQGLEITLRGLQFDASGNMSEFINKKATAAADGSFSFGDLPFDKPDSGYVVQTTYNGVEFVNGNAIESGSATLDLPITVYEATNDPAVVQLDSRHLLLQQHPDALVVIEVLAFSNVSDKVYVTPDPVAGGKLGSVSINIPSDAYGIQFQDGDVGGRYIQNGEIYYDTEPVQPGANSHSISVSYILPFSGSRDLTLTNEFETTQLNVLSAEGITVSGDGLTANGTSAFQGANYTKYGAANLQAGSTLTIKVGKQLQLTADWRTILSVALGVMVIASVVYWIMRGRVDRRDETEEIGGDEQEVILRELAELDAAFKDGQITRFDYEARRAALKAELAEQMDE